MIYILISELLRIIMAGQWRYTRGKAEPTKKYGISPLTFPLMEGVM
jgi:hypothetical protein